MRAVLAALIVCLFATGAQAKAHHQQRHAHQDHHHRAARACTVVAAPGLASFYTTADGVETASGEGLRDSALTAAHKTLCFGLLVRVTNLRNRKSVVVRITDRGPYIAGRVIDLTLAGARAIGMVRAGVAPVDLEIVR